VRRAGGLVPAVLLALPVLLAAGSSAPGHVDRIRVSGTINPASSEYIQKSIQQAADDGAQALILELDTPGGLVSSTKDIIQAMLNAAVPVVVYVAPQGAWAGSAGTYITLAGNVAAMAPGTTIGAAHPVGVGMPGGEGEQEKGGQSVEGEKAENMLAAYIASIARERKRNVEWAVNAVRHSVAIPSDEALKLGVIDLVAPTLPDLLDHIDGRTVRVSQGERVLATRGAAVRTLEMTPIERFMHVLANPDLAVLLIIGGLLGLYLEFTQPGMILPGVAGVTCLVLGAISLQILPFSWLGLILFLSGLGLLVAEVIVSSYGILFALGIVCLLIGGTLIFDLPRLNDVGVSFWTVLVPAVLGMALFAAIVIFGVSRTLRTRQTAGTGELIGLTGRADTVLGPQGKVFVRGEFWDARADEQIAAGERVEVTAVEGMRLRVRRAPPEA
jgi:membrane-bound serine protease (ClpP class)